MAMPTLRQPAHSSHPQLEAPSGSLAFVDAARASLACRRSSPRRLVRWNAVAYHRGRARGMHVVIRNISQGGLMLENAFGAIEGDCVRVVLLSGRALDGQIMWAVSPYCGLRFDIELDARDALMLAR